VEKAPPDVVEKERDKVAELETHLERLRTQHADLA